MRQSSIRRAKAFSALTAILLSLCACGESREAVGGYQPSAVFMEEGAYTEPLRVSRGGMELILDPGTLELTLRRDDGSVWSSYIAAPEGTADEDMAAYRTLLEISYYTKTGGKAGQEILLSSWKDCIARGQYAIEREDDGFLVTLVLGKADRSRVLPPAASRAFFEEMLEKLPSERAKRRMQAFYKLYDLAAASDDNQRREWLAVYPVLEETAIYVLQNGASDRDKDELEGYLVEAGYTLEEVEEESAYAGVWQKAEERPLFEIPLRLRLEDGDFTAEILTQGIGYDTSSYLLNRVRLLPFFAGLHQSDDGYLFFPDGSGAVIDLRTGRRRLTSKITARIYGDDLSVTDTLSDIRCRLPVFGAGGTAGAVLGIVEKGDAVAELTCEYGGTVNRSHYVYPTYIHCEYLTMNSQEEVSTGLNLSVWSSTAPADGFKVRYRFTGADTADYSALAALYRDYLTQAGLLVPGSAEPFRYQLETLGGVQTDERFLFFDVSKTARLTGLARSGELAASLAEYGVGDVALRVSGIAKGGLNGRAVSGLSVRRSRRRTRRPGKAAAVHGGGGHRLRALLRFADGLRRRLAGRLFLPGGYRPDPEKLCVGPHKAQPGHRTTGSRHLRLSPAGGQNHRRRGNAGEGAAGAGRRPAFPADDRRAPLVGQPEGRRRQPAGIPGPSAENAGRPAGVRRPIL